jgi:hypothetical protein
MATFQVWAPAARRVEMEFRTGSIPMAAGRRAGHPVTAGRVCYSVRRAVAVLDRAAQLAGSSAPRTAMASADSASTTISAGL